MSEKEQLKTYLASMGAVQMFPGIIVVEQLDKVLSCVVDGSVNPSGEFFIGFAHVSRILVRYEEAEARENALREAHSLFPEEDGWRNHAVFLVEVPRSTFIEMQLFTSIREICHRILRLTGFRRAA